MMRALAILFVPFCFFCAKAGAGVSLFPDLSAVSVAPGGEFQLQLNLLVSGTDKVTSLDYFWQIAPEGAGMLSIVGREMEDSLFAFLLNSNTEVLAAPGNILAPTNDENLGAGVIDPNVPAAAGTWFVAAYTFQVSPSAVPGSYALMTFSNPGKGWAGPAPDFDDFNFATQASVEVLIIPEPEVGILLLGAFALLGPLAWRRTKGGAIARIRQA